MRAYGRADGRAYGRTGVRAGGRTGGRAYGRTGGRAGVLQLHWVTNNLEAYEALLTNILKALSSHIGSCAGFYPFSSLSRGTHCAFLLRAMQLERAADMESAHN